MDIRKALIEDQSKSQALRIAEYIGNDQEKFKSLMHLFFNDDNRMAQRASWVVSKCHDRAPELIIPYIDKMIKGLGQTNLHPAVIRNTVRILQEVKIPKSKLGPLTDHCFNLLGKNDTPVAIKVFSMSILLNVVREIPELAKELQIIIEDQMPYATPGFRSRGNKILNALQKMG